MSGLRAIGFFRKFNYNFCSVGNAKKSLPQQIFRNLTQTPSGALLEKPERLSLGVTKFFVVVTPCVYMGGMISMTGASLLEDYDIFVPEDEDD